MSEITDVLNAHHAIIKSLVDEYVPLLGELRKANDPIPSAVQIYEVMRRLNDVSKSFRDDIKAAIVRDMVATGVVASEAGPYHVTLKKGAVRAVVSDEKKLRSKHPEFFTPQPDKLSLKDLSNALKFNHDIEGAELVEGEPTIAVKGAVK